MPSDTLASTPQGFQPTYQPQVISAPSSMERMNWDEFSLDEKVRVKPEIVNLGLETQEILRLQAMQYGYSKALQEKFDHLSTRSGEPTQLLKTSFVFEKMARDAEIATLGYLLGVQCGTARAYCYSLAEAWWTAFNLQLTITDTTVHLATIDEAQRSHEDLIRALGKISKKANKAMKAAVHHQNLQTGWLPPSSTNFLQSFPTDEINRLKEADKSGN